MFYSDLFKVDFLVFLMPILETDTHSILEFLNIVWLGTYLCNIKWLKEWWNWEWNLNKMREGTDSFLSVVDVLNGSPPA